MATADTIYAARLELPEELERGRDNTIKCPVRRDGALVAPSAGTVSVWNASDSFDSPSIVNAQSVTITASVAEYAVLDASTSGEDFGEGWRVEWALTMPDGVVHTFRNDASLVRRSLYPVVTAEDLYRRHPDLEPGVTGSLVAAGETHQVYLDEAWISLQLKLIAKGNRPNLIISPTALRDVHLALTLELIWRHFSTTGREDGKWATLADHYRAAAMDAWRDLRFLYDDGDDGRADDRHRRRSAVGSVWLNDRGSTWLS